MNDSNASWDSDETFPPEQRLRKRPEFLRVTDQGERCQGEYLIVYLQPNELSRSRLGLTVSSRVGSAVERNWWKRRLREAFRRSKGEIAEGYDIVVIVQADASQPDFAKLKNEFLHLTDRATDRIG